MHRENYHHDIYLWIFWKSLTFTNNLKGEPTKTDGDSKNLKARIVILILFRY